MKKKENGEVKLYNKYAYDYFNTRDCEEERGGKNNGEKARREV